MKYLWFGNCLLALALSACTTPTTKQNGNPIRIRWMRDPETLDPLAQPNQYATEGINLLHMSLLQLDLQAQRYAPALAESLPTVRPLNDSLTQLDYRLRPAATWDNGRPVLATDVAFTLKLMNCPGLPHESTRLQFSFIRQILLDSADPRHFRLICQGQATENILESGDFPVLSEAALDSAHSLRQFSLAELVNNRLPAKTPALVALAKQYQAASLGQRSEYMPGCGPYQFANWQFNQSLTFKRKKKWWADKLRPAPLVLQAHPQALEFVILPEDAAAMLALQRHELDIYPQVSARDFRRLQASAGAQRDLTFYSGASYDVVYAAFNTQRPMLRDKYTRQALSCLFDPAGLLAGTQLGQGSRTVGLLPPSSPYYNDSLALPTYAPAKARGLLRKAGWQLTDGGWQRPPAQRLALALRYRANDITFETTALQFRAAAAQLGIPVELQPTEGTSFTGALRDGNFDMYVRTLKGNPFTFNFAPVLHSQAIGEGNFMGFKSTAIDRVLENIITASPTRKRYLLRRFQALLQDEAPLAPLFFSSYRLAASNHLSHLIPSGIKPGYAATAIIWVEHPLLAQ